MSLVYSIFTFTARAYSIFSLSLLHGPLHVYFLAGSSLEQGTQHSAHGPMLLPPAVAQKLRPRLVQLRAVSRCCIVLVCQRLTMLRLLLFTCRFCTRLPATNKTCNSKGNLRTQEKSIFWCSGNIFFKSRLRHFSCRICNPITRQAIELESCSDPLRIQQVLQSKSKKTIFGFGEGFSEDDVIKRTCFGKVDHFWPALGPNPLAKALFGLSGQILAGHNSTSDRARELFKPCNDQWLRVVQNKKKFFNLDEGFWANGLMMGVYFLVNYMTSSSDPTRQQCGSQYFWILG